MSASVLFSCGSLEAEKPISFLWWSDNGIPPLIHDIGGTKKDSHVGSSHFPSPLDKGFEFCACCQSFNDLTHPIITLKIWNKRGGKKDWGKKKRRTERKRKKNLRAALAKYLGLESYLIISLSMDNRCNAE